MVFLPMGTLRGSPPKIDTWPTPIVVFDYILEGNDYPWARMDFYPYNENQAWLGYDVMYIQGSNPSYQWDTFELFAGGLDDWDGLLGPGEMWVKCDIISHIGVEDTLLWDNGGAMGVWHDLWDEYELWQDKVLINGTEEIFECNVSLAVDNGSGAPDLTKVRVKPVTFRSYRGDQEFIIGDHFTDTGGSLEIHDPDVNRSSVQSQPWVDLYWAEGDFTKGNMTISGNQVLTVGTDQTIHVLESDVTNINFATDIDYRASLVDAGLVGRVQDTGNHWLLACKNPESVDPMLGLYKVVATVHNLVASVTATGLGPIDGFGDYVGINLIFEGNEITGRMNLSFPTTQDGRSGPLILTHTDATYNTETRCGLWGENAGIYFRGITLFNSVIGFDPIVWGGALFTSSIDEVGTSAYTNIYFYPGPNGPPIPPYDSTCGYWIDKDNIGGKTVFDHRVTFINTNTFAIKYDDVSGDTDHVSIQYGAEGTQAGIWFEAYNLNIAVEAEIGESWTATINITVAVLDIAGNPVPSSYHSRQVTIHAAAVA
jgi:hypothetical protein